jgi:hypothetical protein
MVCTVRFEIETIFLGNQAIAIEYLESDVTLVS